MTNQRDYDHYEYLRAGCLHMRDSANKRWRSDPAWIDWAIFAFCAAVIVPALWARWCA